MLLHPGLKPSELSSYILYVEAGIAWVHAGQTMLTTLKVALTGSMMLPGMSI